MHPIIYSQRRTIGLVLKEVRIISSIQLSDFLPTWILMTIYHSLNFIGSFPLKPMNRGLKPEDSLRSLLKTSCSSDVTTHCSGINSLDPSSHPVDCPHTKLFLSCMGRDSRLSCEACWINQRILRPHSLKTSRFLWWLHPNTVNSCPFTWQLEIREQSNSGKTV